MVEPLPRVNNMRPISKLVLLFVALVCLVLIAGCRVQADTASAQTLPPQAAAEGGGPLASELDPLVEELFALDLSPGLAVAVVRNGELVYARGFGYADVENSRPVDQDTRFYIASSTKSFTGLTTALLARDGRLDLDGTLRDYLPEVSFVSDLASDEIRVRDLLTMSDGIRQDGPFVFRLAFSGEFTESKLTELLSRAEPSAEGRVFRYRNLPYNVLGMIVERATGLGWKEAVAEEVLVPLGLHSTTAYMSQVERDRLALPYRSTPDGFARAPQTKDDANMHAAGGHLTSVLDLARWIEVFLEDGEVDGIRVFPPDVIGAAKTVQVPQDREFSVFHRHGWGYGWDIGTYDGDTLVHRFGSYTGARPHVSFMPEHGIGVVALTNERALGGRLVDAVATRLYDHLLGKPDARWDGRVDEIRSAAADFRGRVAAELAVRAGRQAPLPLTLSAYVGRYANDDFGTVVVEEREGGLYTRMGLVHSPAEVYSADDHAIRVELTGGGSVITFLPTGNDVPALRYREREFVKGSG